MRLNKAMSNCWSQIVICLMIHNTEKCALLAIMHVERVMLQYFLIDLNKAQC